MTLSNLIVTSTVKMVEMKSHMMDLQREMVARFVSEPNHTCTSCGMWRGEFCKTCGLRECTITGEVQIVHLAATHFFTGPLYGLDAKLSQSEASILG